MFCVKLPVRGKCEVHVCVACEITCLRVWGVGGCEVACSGEKRGKSQMSHSAMWDCKVCSGKTCIFLIQRTCFVETGIAVKKSHSGRR